MYFLYFGILISILETYIGNSTIDQIGKTEFTTEFLTVDNTLDIKITSL